jgi:hypothetical protein
MATKEEIKQELTKADVRLDEATKNLENFMKEENLEKFEKRWGTEAMKEEKKRLVKDKDDWKKQVVEWGKRLREFGGGEGNEQIV